MRRLKNYACCLLVLSSMCITVMMVHHVTTVSQNTSHKITSKTSTQQFTMLRNVTIPTAVRQPPCTLRQRPIYHIDKTASKPLTRLVIPDFQDRSTPEEKLVREFSFQPRYSSYPVNGTGVTVDVSSDFDENVFNSFCDSPPDLKAVLPVYSSPDRFGSRRLLRESLGELAKSLNCKMFFILGVSLDDNINAMLKEEYVREKDILMIDKLDTYRDLNNKAYAMIAWISKHCSHVPFTIHVIDDTYVNLKWYLQQLDGTKEDNFMLAPRATTRTIRTTQPRSFVTVEEYIYDRFPTYAYGFVYAFRSSVASRLLSVAHSARYCWIEDVWIGGHVRAAAGLKVEPVGNIKTPPSHNKANRRRSVPTNPVWHKVLPERLCQWYRYWL